jgi:ABC-type transport system substrate-binding protein
VDRLIEEELYGRGERSVTFVHSKFKEKINPKLKYHDFNIETARELLAEGDWIDTGSDGIIDKIIDGKKTAFSIRIDFNNGNSKKEKTCVLLKEAAEKVGIEMEIIPLEWTAYLDKHNKHDFDLYVGGWVSRSCGIRSEANLAYRILLWRFELCSVWNSRNRQSHRKTKSYTRV